MLAPVAAWSSSLSCGAATLPAAARESVRICPGPDCCACSTVFIADFVPFNKVPAADESAVGWGRVAVAEVGAIDVVAGVAGSAGRAAWAVDDVGGVAGTDRVGLDE